MSQHRESVPPSPDPDAAVGTGSGHDPGGVTPPPEPSEGASTTGLGSAASQQGETPPGNAPYSLDGDENPTEKQSPSGT
jgi:hypothetical protein